MQVLGQYTQLATTRGSHEGLTVEGKGEEEVAAAVDAVMEGLEGADDVEQYAGDL